MKRRFVFLAILFCSQFAFGQVSEIMSDYLPADITKTILKNYTNENSISYIETVTDHFFVYFDNGLSGYTNKYVVIDRDLFVNDFSIRNDSVFFCGSINGRGAVGFFDIDKFFFNGGDYYTYALFYASDTVKTLNRLVTYLSSTNEVHIVCIGLTDLKYHCITDYIFSENNTPRFQVGELSNYLDETLKDIAVTDNYVVTAGFVTNGRAYISLRRFEKDDILYSGSMYDFALVYDGYGSGLSTFPDENIIMDHYNGDTVATAAYYQYSGTPFDGVEIIWHDIGNVGILPIMAKNIIDIEYGQAYNHCLRELVCDKNLKMVYLLRNRESSDSVRNSILEVRYNPLTYIYDYRIKTVFFLSLDKKITDKYIFNGYSKTTNMKYYYGNKRATYNSDCLIGESFHNNIYIPII